MDGCDHVLSINEETLIGKGFREVVHVRKRFTFQAEHVIREQLKIKETPDLLCSLGEVTDEFEYFERAWTLSKERNGRAQRLMGKYYFNRGNVCRVSIETIVTLFFIRLV